jgi:hypothetical protein
MWTYGIHLVGMPALTDIAMPAAAVSQSVTHRVKMPHRIVVHHELACMPPSNSPRAKSTDKLKNNKNARFSPERHA